MSNGNTQTQPKRRTRRDVILSLAFTVSVLVSIGAAIAGSHRGLEFRAKNSTAKTSCQDQLTHSFDYFAYLMVMPGIAATLALNRLLVGVALLLRRRKNIVLCKMIQVPWALWALLLFALLIQYWHTTSMCAQTGWVGNNLARYASFFIYPAMTYLAYTVLMPHDVPPQGSFDLRRHYYDHAVPFFIICSIGLALEIALSEYLQCAPCCHATDIKGENWLRASGSCAALVLVFTQFAVGTGWKRTVIHWIVTGYVIGLFYMFVHFFRSPFVAPSW